MNSFFKKIYNSLDRLLGLRIKNLKAKYPTTIFIDDSNINYDFSSCKKAVILGNAKNVNSLTQEQFNEYNQNKNTLIIGVNRTHLRFRTDILMWADIEIIDEILNDYSSHITNSYVIRTTNNDIKKNLEFWIHNKSFKIFPFKGLFKARNILVRALHLCYLYDIKEITLYGFEFDTRGYFYHNPSIYNANEYEILSEEVIQKKYCGYDTQKIVREVIEFMIDEGFKIQACGESKFLSSIKNIQVKNS